MTQDQKDNPMHIIAHDLAEFFKDEPHKIVYWLFCKNLNFGGGSPAELIVNDRADKVSKFIVAARELKP